MKKEKKEKPKQQADAGWQGGEGSVDLSPSGVIRTRMALKNIFFIVVVCVFVTRLGCKRERKRRFFRVGSEMLRIQF